MSPTNVETEVLSSASPSLSLSWRPTESLTLQAGWQGSRTTGIETVSRVKIRGLDGDPNSQREDVSRLSLGQVAPRLDLEVAWRRGDSGIAAGVTIHQSSTLQTMHSEAISGGLNDSLTARLGGRLALTDGWRLMGAVSYRSSAVPEQTGRQNLVDNDLAAASFGASWSHRSAWGNLRVSAGWKAPTPTRTHTKRADAPTRCSMSSPTPWSKTTDPIAEARAFRPTTRPSWARGLDPQLLRQRGTQMSKTAPLRLAALVVIFMAATASVPGCVEAPGNGGTEDFQLDVGYGPQGSDATADKDAGADAARQGDAAGLPTYVTKTVIPAGRYASLGA